MTTSKTEIKEKSDVELLKEIWDAQGELNKIVGFDTLAIFNERGNSGKWEELLTDYFDEAANEVFECKENIIHKWWVSEVKEDPTIRFNIQDTAKVKLELIDVLHFLMSAAQVNHFPVHSVYPELNAKSRDANFTNRQFYHLLNLIIKNCILKETAYAFIHLLAAFKHFNMSIKEVHKIYFMKNKANLARQQNKYSMGSKTEKDNEVIEKEIKQNEKPRKKR
jgi:dimeric dUTPase (all-alpha-NTP-PPase superfamily)